MNDKKRRTTAPTRPSRRRIEKLALVAKALSHPARVEIVLLLHARQTCVGCDIVDEVGLAQSTTSEHLRLLKEAEVIVGEIERPRVCYSLNTEALEPLHALLGELRAGSGGMLVNTPIGHASAPRSARRSPANKGA
jgi:ArsR family transcriptional regulator